MSDVDELAKIREENRLLIEDRSRFPAKPDAIGRIIDAYHANRDAKMVDLEIRCRNSLSEIARLREERRWVPVGERLPDRMQTVWVLSSLGAHTASLDSFGQWLDDDENPAKKITHWQPLPPGPEGE
jgi:hypothetical protein